MATIAELEKELIGLISGLKEFKNKTYSIYSLEDLERLTEGQSANLPLVGVGYTGAEPTGNEADPKVAKAGAAVLVNLQFMVMLAVSYQGAGQKDSKPDATDLLGEIRNKVLGYKNVNARAWRFIGERPELEASGDGVIFYSQVWQTAVVVVGNS